MKMIGKSKVILIFSQIMGPSKSIGTFIYPLLLKFHKYILPLSTTCHMNLRLSYLRLENRGHSFSQLCVQTLVYSIQYVSHYCPNARNKYLLTHSTLSSECFLHKSCAVAFVFQLLPTFQQ